MVRSSKEVPYTALLSEDDVTRKQPNSSSKLARCGLKSLCVASVIFLAIIMVRLPGIIRFSKAAVKTRASAAFLSVICMLK